MKNIIGTNIVVMLVSTLAVLNLDLIVTDLGIRFLIVILYIPIHIAVNLFMAVISFINKENELAKAYLFSSIILVILGLCCFAFLMLNVKKDNQ